MSKGHFGHAQRRVRGVAEGNVYAWALHQNICDARRNMALHLVIPTVPEGAVAPSTILASHVQGFYWLRKNRLQVANCGPVSVP